MTKFSSLKNAIPRKTKKERSQPKWRRDLGYGTLEKHKDYKVRSRKAHQIEEQKKLLHEQIKNKNEDEYFIDMAHATKTDTGTTVIEKIPTMKKKKEALNNLKKTKKEQRLFVQQNAEKNLNLLRMKLQIINNNIEKLRRGLGFLEVASKSDKKIKHKVFLKSKEELETFDPVEYFDTDPLLLNQTHNRVKRKTLAEQSVQAYAPNAGIDAYTTPATDNATLAEYKKLEKLISKREVIEKTINDIEVALQLTLSSDKVEKIERDKSTERKNLKGDYSDVKTVQFKKERKR
ncbi:U3 small nucleolar RNA-associated protein 11 [Naegleria gruberi]|uniref:U3 small nucleolar RNA-associated protein 11 n=1 Tax=Naegleria gruberi TaxID=5762 RepID=D2VB81_NAEGR|nr:U3 small nucleolar RNA-associated protein 11 [Naegleria gruberi]EFC45750.1 U3 small nucleolar RNA-associated protein 11 [Naegleria gruberi]|eukprot:XP_002678494.1 U3 small nucleolar RNA-associated protein 11 [Naegleria gruberi strain NEG-M]